MAHRRVDGGRTEHRLGLRLDLPGRPDHKVPHPAGRGDGRNFLPLARLLAGGVHNLSVEATEYQPMIYPAVGHFLAISTRARRNRAALCDLEGFVRRICESITDAMATT